MPKLPPSALPAEHNDQSIRFIETARTLGADEDEATFRAKLAEIARQKPASDVKPTKGSGQKK